jgi:hypothetical protein
MLDKIFTKQQVSLIKKGGHLDLSNLAELNKKPQKHAINFKQFLWLLENFQQYNITSLDVSYNQLKKKANSSKPQSSNNNSCSLQFNSSKLSFFNQSVKPSSTYSAKTLDELNLATCDLDDAWVDKFVTLPLKIKIDHLVLIHNEISENALKKLILKFDLRKISFNGGPYHVTGFQRANIPYDTLDQLVQFAKEHNVRLKINLSPPRGDQAAYKENLACLRWVLDKLDDAKSPIEDLNMDLWEVALNEKGMLERFQTALIENKTLKTLYLRTYTEGYLFGHASYTIDLNLNEILKQNRQLLIKVSDIECFKFGYVSSNIYEVYPRVEAPSQSSSSSSTNKL